MKKSEIRNMIIEELETFNEANGDSQFNDAKQNLNMLLRDMNKDIKKMVKNIVKDYLKNGENGDAISDMNALCSELKKIEIG